jgi:hypothetical protein
MDPWKGAIAKEDDVREPQELAMLFELAPLLKDRPDFSSGDLWPQIDTRQVISGEERSRFGIVIKTNRASVLSRGKMHWNSRYVVD